MNRRMWKQYVSLIILNLFLAYSVDQIQFYRVQQRVLQANPRVLQKLGRHFIVGYRDFNEIHRLVSHGAIGGVFITSRNVHGKSVEELRREINLLQDTQASLGLPPLIISADQEGGLVSRLSPLVTSQDPIAEWIQKKTASEYAEVQARDLSALGINLNLSPVADLKTSISEKSAGHSCIGKRAISSDPLVVAKVATEYCQTLERFNIGCTLKHFPGMGHVEVDTHIDEGVISLSQQQLEANDWQPFRYALHHSKAALMLGHARVPAVDSEFPASLSKKIIQGIIREQWLYQGILVTDDFAMGPILSRAGGLSAAATTALNAGVDLILVANDGDLYYEAMDGLLSESGQKKLDQKILSESDTRLRDFVFRISPVQRMVVKK